jgi:sugar-specific transcriptional regulator TrmB
MLMSLGLTEYEAKVYAALLASGTCTVKEISFKSDVPRTKIYPTMRGLEKRGMILFLPEEPLKCKALPPDIALSPKVSQQEETLRRTKRALAEVKKAFESYKITEDLERQELWVLKKDQAIQNKLAAMIGEATAKVLFVIGEGGLGIFHNCRQQLRDASFNNVELTGFASMSKDNLAQLRDVGAFAGLHYLANVAKYSLCVVDETDLLVFWSESQGEQRQMQFEGVFAGNIDLSSFVEGFVSRDGISRGINLETITPLIENELTSTLDSSSKDTNRLSANGFETLFSSFAPYIDSDKMKEALSNAGKKALTYLAGQGYLDAAGQDLESILKILTAWMAVFDRVNVKFKFDGLLKMLTCEVSGEISPSYESAAKERREVFPSLWGLALLGVLDSFGYESLVLKNVYDEKRRTWIIQRKLSKKEEVAAEA